MELVQKLIKKTSKYLFYSPLTEKVLTECPCMFYVDSFRRRRVPLEMRVKLQKVKLKNPVMKKKTGKNIKRVKRKRRSTRRKRKSINVVMIIVMRMRSLQRK